MGSLTKAQPDNERARIGSNGGPSFDDIVRDNKDRGLLLTMKEVIVEAVRDPRLDRRHLRVLAEVISAINMMSGAAYPGHRTIANALRRHNVEGYQDFGYSDQGIRNTLSDLVSFGYLVSTRRAAEKGGRALAHYTIRKPSIEDLQNQITDWIMAQRLAPPREHPVASARRSGPDVTSGNDVTPPSDVIQGGDVRQGDDIRPDVTQKGDIRPTFSGFGASGTTNQVSDVTPRPDVTSGPDVTSDVTSPVPTVTRRKELGERTDVGAGEREAEAGPGEDHVGHGVFVNGHTIRHSAFAISLPGIQMGTLNSGLTANEVKDYCIAHALQWAAEIEIGKSPRDVVPSKVANFLSRSIMGAVNQQKIQAVRTKREEQPFAGRARGAPGVTGSGPIETTAQRLERMALAMEKGGKS